MTDPKLCQGVNPNENVRDVLTRLRLVTGQLDEDIAGPVIKSIVAEKGDRKIARPDRLVILACSIPTEEAARWRHKFPKGALYRSIQAARQVVDQYLDQLGYAKNWDAIDQLSPDDPRNY